MSSAVVPKSDLRLRLQTTYIGPIAIGWLLGSALRSLLIAFGYVVEAAIMAVSRHGFRQPQGAVRALTANAEYAAEYAIGGVAIAWLGFLLAFWLYPRPATPDD